jgi:hypothetical protein
VTIFFGNFDSKSFAYCKSIIFWRTILPCLTIKLCFSKIEILSTVDQPIFVELNVVKCAVKGTQAEKYANKCTVLWLMTGIKIWKIVIAKNTFSSCYRKLLKWPPSPLSVSSDSVLKDRSKKEVIYYDMSCLIKNSLYQGPEGDPGQYPGRKWSPQSRKHMRNWNLAHQLSELS